jgi:signal transduction histidine kinase
MPAGTVPQRRLLFMGDLQNRPYRAVAGIGFLGLLITASAGIAAGESGTAEEAKAMLERAVAAIKADEAAALSAFTAGTEGFKDRDLYVFCGDATDGLITANGANSALIGQSMRDIKDKAGKAIGKEFYPVATEGEFMVVEYVWPRPGETKPSPKASYITKVGNQICGAGYCK